MTHGPLSAGDIQRLFGEPASELNSRGVRGETEHPRPRRRVRPDLLAMKLFSPRVEADAEDIALLYRQVGYTTVAEGLALVERTYSGRPVAARVQFLLEEIVRALDG